jgi:hypothetical protein
LLTFKSFLFEQAEDEPRQIKHLTHVEDRPLQTGSKGTQHAISSLNATAEHIKAGKHTSELTTKYDGSPAIVYGHHPETGKFFVASKSAFNKTPKVNYNHSDIEKNHGHAPGLSQKLKDALEHLPKVAPSKGVYQGDMMFSHDDKKNVRGGVSFHPNPSGLTYTASGDTGKRAKQAKIGVVTHLKYHGKDSASLSAHHDVDHENFAHHPDVFSVDPRHDTSKVHFSKSDQSSFNRNISAAKKIHDEHGDKMYAATEKHQGTGGHLESYINHTVRTGETPNHEGLKKFIETKYNKDIDKLKSEKGKEKKKTELVVHLFHIDKNKEQYNNLLKMHGHLAKAKNTLINTLNQHQDFQHTHAGENANPEGYVFHHNGDTDKLVNRQEFSRRNFAGIRNFAE